MSMTQREYQRVPLQTFAEVDIAGGCPSEAMCLNISMGGMALLLKGDIPEMTPGEVRIKYDHPGDSLEFRARFSVVWTRAAQSVFALKQAGIRFKDLDDENRLNLARIIVQRITELERINGNDTALHGCARSSFSPSHTPAFRSPAPGASVAGAAAG